MTNPVSQEQALKDVLSFEKQNDPTPGSPNAERIARLRAFITQSGAALSEPVQKTHKLDSLQKVQASPDTVTVSREDLEQLLVNSARLYKWATIETEHDRLKAAISHPSPPVVSPHSEGEAACAKCGGPMSKNPHPNAGEPSSLVEFGAVWVCIPCTVQTRHAWAERAAAAEAKLDAHPTQAEVGVEQRIFTFLRDYRLSNMTCEGTTDVFYPLVDAVTHPEAKDIGNGEEEIQRIANLLADDLLSWLSPKDKGQ